jgi:SOS-response transcriptional repressor LexA
MAESIGKRIERLLELKNGGNQSELARFVGVSPQAVQQWVADETSPRGKNLERAAEFLGVAPAELRFGLQKVTPNVAPAPVGSRQIPLISCVQAGMWTEISDNYAPGDASEWLLTDLELSGSAFALEIKGDSMLPDFRPGDRVIIDPEIAPSPGDFVVAKNGSNEATFKKYRSRGINERGDHVFELVPLNTDYETIRSDYTPVVIIGTMVEHRRYRRR